MSKPRDLMIRMAVLAVLAGPAGRAVGQTSTAAQPTQDALERAFENPPDSAKPRVWWHWMNGNITQEGIHSVST